MNEQYLFTSINVNYTACNPETVALSLSTDRPRLTSSCNESTRDIHRFDSGLVAGLLWWVYVWSTVIKYPTDCGSTTPNTRNLTRLHLWFIVKKRCTKSKLPSHLICQWLKWIRPLSLSGAQARVVDFFHLYWMSRSFCGTRACATIPKFIKPPLKLMV